MLSIYSELEEPGYLGSDQITHFGVIQAIAALRRTYMDPLYFSYYAVFSPLILLTLLILVI